MTVREQVALAPEDITSAFYSEKQPQLDLLTGGLVNRTLLVTGEDGTKSILQRLSPMFNKIMAADFNVVSDHLRSEDWEVATARPAIDGQTYLDDQQGNLWRSFTFIESDGEVPVATNEVNIALGGLLGALHNSLGRLDYKPQFALPHFHETDFYANKLESLLPRFGDGYLQTLATTWINLTRANKINTQNTQLIHGDPKLNNALYRSSEPFTFVDFDTLMHASPLVDLGDMLRSITGKLMVKNAALTSKEVEPIISAYYETAKPGKTEKSFLADALSAGQIIALELAIRYMIDSVEGQYFDWDSDSFASRADHNIARAQIQWQTYQALAA